MASASRAREGRPRPGPRCTSPARRGSAGTRSATPAPTPGRPGRRVALPRPRTAGFTSTAITGTTFGTTGGTFLVGSFREGATLWERDTDRLHLSDSHASNFTSNILTLLAELRAALTVLKPSAFVKGTLGASRA